MKTATRALLILAIVLGPVACRFPGSDPVVVKGDIPLAYVKRTNNLAANPTDSLANNARGDLYIRAQSSPSANEYNITGTLTNGVGDVSDPEVSYDGKKIVFAMRCRAGSSTQCNTDPTWSIWEYDMTDVVDNNLPLNQGTFRRVMPLADAVQGDDLDPAYLPGNRGFVFTSNRQQKASGKIKDPANPGQNYPAQPGYIGLDEYERERTVTLHTMTAAGGNITQISVNQSHDRNPVVRSNGMILYSRWDHVGGRNHFAIFEANPDGTEMFVAYGAHSPGNSFLHPREMQDGSVVTTLMPLSRTQEGGALMKININDYSENNTPAGLNVSTPRGQEYLTREQTTLGRGLAIGGRYTTPYPLWDNTNRVLVSHSPCQVRDTSEPDPAQQVKSCRHSDFNSGNGKLWLDELLASTNGVVSADNPLTTNVTPAYGIYMLDLDSKSLRPVVPVETRNESGTLVTYIATDPIPLQAHAEPNIINQTGIVASLADQNLGQLEIRSVYDTDSGGRMGAAFSGGAVSGSPTLTAAELGRLRLIPAPATDPRPQVVDLAATRDPTHTSGAYQKRVARFIRITQAVPSIAGGRGAREAIGETDFEMQKILGYAEVEPDGSAKLRLPADIPLAITVLDDKGRAFQTHTNWIQVRPGETRTCHGCHSPRRGEALNTGETMATARTDVDPSRFYLMPNIEYRDIVAANPADASPCISIRYLNNLADCAVSEVTTNATFDLPGTIPSPVASGSGYPGGIEPIIINYPDHIQPIWERDRGGNTCTSCHGAGANLDLTGGISGTGRMVSYQELLVGDPVLIDGVPQFITIDGVQVVQRLPALVSTAASQDGSGVTGLARKSRLTEILYGERIKSSDEALAAHPNPPVDHTAMLNKAELRLVTEWVDIGGQYYNDPTVSGGGVRTVSGLSMADFAAIGGDPALGIHQTLLNRCGSCHQALGSDGAPLPTFNGNRFVLTGNEEGDFNVTASMVNNTSCPQDSYLLSRPLSAGLNPLHGVDPVTGNAIFANPATDADYQRIYNWILAASGSAVPSCP